MSNTSPNRKKNTVQQLLAKVSEQEVKLREAEFFAAYSPDSKTASVQMIGTNYKFRIIGFEGDGFGVFKPVDPTCAKFVREADPVQVEEYLKLWPYTNLILVCQTNLGWCGYPFNVSASKAQLGLEQEVIVHNVSDAERFDVVTVRCDGARFWYHEPFAGGDPIRADLLRTCFANRGDSSRMQKTFRSISGVVPEEIKAFDLALASWRQFERMTTADHLEEILSMGGAAVENYVIRGRNIEVAWKADSGARFNSLVDKSTFDVVSAGICLNDEDQKFHLKDLPGIVRLGEDRDAIFRTRQVRGIELDELPDS